ncbi:DoxX family protein [Actinoplanes sp. NPDC000266]
MIVVLVVLVAAAANAYAAVADFTGSGFATGNSARVGVPASWLPVLGGLKAAGVLGLLLGLAGVPLIGAAAATGLVLFFVGAISFHLRAHEHRFLRVTVAFLLLNIAALTLPLVDGRG